MRVLIVDDEKNIRESIKKYLGLENMDSTGAESGEEALEILEREHIDAVVLDLKLPGMSGQQVLESMRERGILPPVIMVSAHGEIADAVAALKAGAEDYLVKPFDPAELIIKIRTLVENRRHKNIIEAEKRTRGKETLLTGESAAMRKLSERIDKIAARDVTVLITGESGTGKEVTAREIHNRGPNRGEPFVAVNIGGIHEGLMESELFGHEKGSFTGAASRKLGLFELAGKGTIFLDEIGEMPAALQVKLLRVIQERRIRRLGGIADIPVNARIISATNRNLEALVGENKFREDLYYRLNVFRISLPPLRERREDIPLLAACLLERLGERMGKPPPALSQGAEKRLLVYGFPGNIRELENILERAVIYCGDNPIAGEDIDLHDRGLSCPPAALLEETALPQAEKARAAGTGDGGEDPGAGEPLSIEAVERKAILDTLARCGGNRTKTAEVLGISRKTLFNKLREYGI